MMYKTVAVVLIAVFTVLLMINYAPGTAEDEEETGHLYSTTRILMDTTVTISVLSSGEDEARASIEKAFEKIQYVDNLMNNYENSSELSLLNEQGTLNNTNPDLIYVINKSKYYSESSQGAFDISIFPILELWKSKFSPGGTYEAPTEEEINETLELVDYSSIRIEDSNITLDKEGMMLTLGGVAKGYAVDLAIRSLRDDGVEAGFVNAGGDGKYIGHKQVGVPWKVGLQNPDRTEEAIVVMEMEDMAVATSGNYERYFNDAAKVSHISDPRTGYPSQDLISVTVITESAMDADAFATAVFVMGEDDGLEMVERLDGVECLIITSDKRLIRSGGFAEYESI
ncbi:FAD:protein FMN transferase [Methanolobus halotolerans]|uniref:FAD:protein FMN transferase n=1 Tax=Methanolobus halotolerans TaxID=2052935 RepID=A0A4E0QBE9_9EURY|nr:FAD:protein FMN transferase [Methanolobus halotolerans]TGC09854.1 FAD:protein FMN transferase [Methanolobus halotolerans]